MPRLRRLPRRARALYRAASASIAWRLVLGAAAVVAIALVAAAIALPSLYRVGLERQLDAQLEELLNQRLIANIEEKDGQVFLAEPVTQRDFESAYSGNYWQIKNRGKVVAASHSLSGRQLDVRDPDQKLTTVFTNINFPYPPAAVGGPQDLRVASRALGFGPRPEDVSDPARLFIFTVAADREQIDENVDEFRVTIIVAIVGLGMILIGTVFLQVRYGLRPLRRIPTALADIRSGATDRLTGSFASEVEPLAREINALLDHNAEVVERARTHVGNLAHALKTPLAVLTNEAAGREGEFAKTVTGQVGIMREQVDHHLSRARMAARAGILGARTSVMPILEGLARTLEKIYRERNIAITVEGPPEIAFRGERQDLEEMLGNLLDNACKFARTRVAAKAKVPEAGRLRIEIADDGPGVPSEHRRAAQKRGIRLDESAPGSGLGLSIVKDIAEIYGGSFNMDEAKLGGLLAILDLPLGAAPPSRRSR